MTITPYPCFALWGRTERDYVLVYTVYFLLFIFTNTSTTALLLSLLGVPRDLIVDDYNETEINLQPSLDSISKYIERIGLTNREFVLAPKHVCLLPFYYVL